MGDTSKLGVASIQLIENADIVYVSALSQVELQIKTMINKLDAPQDTVGMLHDAGLVPLAFQPASADNLRTFSALIRHDPFDRMILAQAQTEGLTLLTADQTLLDLHLSFVMDARQ